jgi:small subunit ribosomal protein S16
VSVKIRMKRLGRKHRSFFRICATDTRSPRDGRIIEELGTYDPMIPETDARTLLNNERVSYWLGVGAKPSERVKVLLKKYGPNGTHVTAAEEARAKIKAPKALPDPGEPKFVPAPKEPPAPPAAKEKKPAKGAAESPPESAAETTPPPAEAAPAEEAAS